MFMPEEAAFCYMFCEKCGLVPSAKSDEAEARTKSIATLSAAPVVLQQAIHIMRIMRGLMRRNRRR